MVDAFANGVWNDLLGLFVLVAVAVVIYMKVKHKTFDEVMSMVRDLW